MNTNLVKGEKITFFKVNGFAMTSVNRVIVEEQQDNKIIFKESSRKRKKYIISIENIDLLFKGHDLPFKADSDGNVMRGNACLNLVSDLSIKEIRDYIETNCINDISNDTKSHIMLMTPDQASDGEYDLKFENCVYPEITNTSALVDSIRAKK